MYRAHIADESEIMQHLPKEESAVGSHAKRGQTAAIVCSAFYLEVKDWMGLTPTESESVEEGKNDGKECEGTGPAIDGKLACPKCKGKIGNYSWYGSTCSCGKWIVPSFAVHKSKVDFI